jgi:hypothetical protein
MMEYWNYGAVGGKKKRIKKGIISVPLRLPYP